MRQCVYSIARRVLTSSKCSLSIIDERHGHLPKVKGTCPLSWAEQPPHPWDTLKLCPSLSSSWQRGDWLVVQSKRTEGGEKKQKMLIFFPGVHLILK